MISLATRLYASAMPTAIEVAVDVPIAAETDAAAEFEMFLVWSSAVTVTRRWRS